jgi:outer membrane lipoprotein-sorting protein
MKRYIFLLALSFALYLLPVCAVDLNTRPFPTNQYSAVYQNGTNECFRMYSDGKGHVLMSFGSFVRLEDYARYIIYTENTPCVARNDAGAKLDENPIFAAEQYNQQLFLWANEVKQQKDSLMDKVWKSMHSDTVSAVGDRTIDGHLCAGWKSTSNYYPTGFYSQTFWFDKKTGCLVELKTWNNQEQPTIKLFSFRDSAPPDAAFKMPITDPAVWEAVTGRKPARKGPMPQTQQRARASTANTDQPRESNLHMRPMTDNR